jgi:O-antigen/teichoic acid export membrane protein
MAVGFFLSPFILHRLGDVAYSVWVLAVSVVGYLNLLDLGMQSSIIRFVSQGFTKRDHESASDAASAALWVRLQISGVAILVSALIALVFPRAFHIPANLARDAQEAVLLIGASTAVTMTLGVSGAVVSALNRYDLQNYVSLGPTAIRVVGIVWSLRTGHGIAAIALWEFIATLVNRLLQVWVAHRLYPELRYRLKRPQSETLRKVWSYSFYTFLVTVAVQLVYQTDNVVVGKFVSLAAVTIYSIANSLCRYTTQIINAMSGTFMPAASSYEAAGESRSLELLYKNGTRAMMMASLPVLITLIIRGSTFIGLWMGLQYAHPSGAVLTILALPLIFAYANQTASAIAFGVEKHQLIAFWAIGEGVANLVLSIILAHWYGINGVALGTLIPSVIAQLGLWPRYISKLVGLSAFEVLWGVWGPVLAAAVPFAVASWLVDIYFPAHSMIHFLLQVIATLPVFLIPAVIVFRKFVRERVLPTIKQMFAAAV